MTFESRESGSCGKTCRRACWLNLEAHPAQDESEVSLRICSRDIQVTSSLRRCTGEAFALLGASETVALQRNYCGEDRNRTYLGPGYAEPTTVLKTARTTRHPSLSELLIADCGSRIEFFARQAPFGVRRYCAAFPSFGAYPDS